MADGRFTVEAIFKAMDQVTRPMKQMASGVGAAAKRITQAIKQPATAIRDLRTRTALATKGLIRQFRKAGISVSQLRRNIRNTAGVIVRQFRRARQSVDAFGKKLRAVTLGMALGLSTVGFAAADVVKTGMEFQSTLVAASAKFPEGIKKGSDAFFKLEAAARKTGATTEFTAAQSAAGLDKLAMAGFNAEQAIVALPGVVDLATASQTDLATASDIATDTLGAFGLASKDATQLGKNLARVNDVMAKTTTTANTDMVMMFETIKQAGPVARAAGADIETFAALTGTMANAGIKASVAGTSLKNAFVNLSAPSKKAGTALDILKVKTKDSQGNMRDIIDVIEDIGKATAEMGTAERLQKLDAIFGKRGGRHGCAAEQGRRRPAEIPRRAAEI